MFQTGVPETAALECVDLLPDFDSGLQKTQKPV